MTGLVISQTGEHRYFFDFNERKLDTIVCVVLCVLGILPGVIYGVVRQLQWEKTTREKGAVNRADSVLANMVDNASSCKSHVEGDDTSASEDYNGEITGIRNEDTNASGVEEGFEAVTGGLVDGEDGRIARATRYANWGLPVPGTEQKLSENTRKPYVFVEKRSLSAMLTLHRAIGIIEQRSLLYNARERASLELLSPQDERVPQWKKDLQTLRQ